MSSDQAERAIAEVEADRGDDPGAEQGLEPDLPPDRTRQFTHTSFSRMRTGWRGDDDTRLAEVKAIADDIIRSEFADAFAVIERIHRYVRTPVVDPSTGEIRAYPDGTPMWEADETGMPSENWGQLGDTERQGILLTIATWLFEWEIRSVDKWAEAMFAKVQWEETFARGFIALPGASITGKPTIDDRTQWGHQFSAEERYFAVFRSVLSRKADALVRSMNRLARLLEGTSSR
jgi:hypothetical protein